MLLTYLRLRCRACDGEEFKSGPSTPVEGGTRVYLTCRCGCYGWVNVAPAMGSFIEVEAGVYAHDLREPKLAKARRTCDGAYRPIKERAW